MVGKVPAREQHAKMNDIVSELKKMTWGVPQGSMISPEQLTDYSHEIGSVVDAFKHVIFADQHLFCSAKNPKY